MLLTVKQTLSWLPYQHLNNFPTLKAKRYILKLLESLRITKTLATTSLSVRARLRGRSRAGAACRRRRRPVRRAQAGVPKPAPPLRRGVGPSRARGPRRPRRTPLPTLLFRRPCMRHSWRAAAAPARPSRSRPHGGRPAAAHSWAWRRWSSACGAREARQARQARVGQAALRAALRVALRAGRAASPARGAHAASRLRRAAPAPPAGGRSAWTAQRVWAPYTR